MITWQLVLGLVLGLVALAAVIARRNTARHLELYFAAPCTGRVLHTLNIRLFPEQLTYIVNHAEDEVIFVDRSLLALLAPLLPTFERLRHLVLMDDGRGDVPDDLAGATFTISNGGVYGSLLSTPILNPPQSAILGMHKIEKRPVAVDDQVVVRPMMYLALSYDHRLIDGKGAVTYLVRVKERLEDPARLLLRV